MSCNCSSNPCSCPNANCSCPANFSINPATIACPNGSQCTDTMYATCVFTNQYLTCSAQPAGTDLNTVLQAMDAKICACGSCSGQTQVSPGLTGMSDYYVDSSNSVLGDGSVVNPFQTIEQAYNKIIGSGTVSSPQRPNKNVFVAKGVGYSVSLNIYIPGCTFTFAPNTVVDFTGAGTYFIDSSVISTAKDTFRCYGYIEFNTSTGGFLKNTGNVIIAELHRVFGNTPGQSQPLIYSGEAGSIDAYTNIKLQSYQSLIISGVQHVVGHYGGALTINLNTGFMIYGMNPFTGNSAGNSSGNIINCNNLNTLSSQHTVIEIQNGNFWSVAATDMISFSGVLVNFVLDNVKSCITGPGTGTLPTTFLNIGNVTVSTVINYHRMLLKEVYLDGSCFSTAAPANVISYTGGGQFFDYLQMQDCVLYNPLTISSTIRLGKSVYSSATVSCNNIINGIIRMTNLPTSSSGLVAGDIWNNSGVITII